LRAEGLGARVQFLQANAESTGLPQASFDLAVSQIVLHETSPEATTRIIRESARLLRPGGVAIHLEVPVRYEGHDVFDQFLSSWEQYYNAESNIEGVATADLPAAMHASGFRELRSGYQPIPPAGTSDPAALKPTHTRMGAAWLIVSGTRASS
jgi:ubiquinone/menaquinone biosynthesis C-methylase UbiE